MSDYGRTICPTCKREIGCYVPTGGDGTGARIRKHNMRGVVVVCPGTNAIVTEWDDI